MDKNIKRITSWLSEIDSKNKFLLEESEHVAILTHLYHAYISNSIMDYDNDYYITKGYANQIVESIPDDILSHLNYAPYNDLHNQYFKFVDLFAGIGGFRLALNKHGGKCVFSSEWDKSAQMTYFANYGDVPFGDIRSFTGEHISDSLLDISIPDHDILTAGFPCQPFSRAGVSARNALHKSHGFDCETQGTLFYDIIRIISVKKPKIVFLENVKNLISHDNGRTFNVIKKNINEQGYKFYYYIINSETLVPQKRIRCYMICIRDDINKAHNFSLDMTAFKGNPLSLETILEPADYVKEYQISEKLWQGHINRTNRNLERGTGFTAMLADLKKPSNTLVARYGKDGKECLIPMQYGPPRKLSIREAARLQGFPDDFVLPLSKTPVYKQMGNSVAVPVVQELARQIVLYLENVNAI
ncbi:MAG: DNA cytosine methyltransferase [Deferribacterales bacterium]